MVDPGVALHRRQHAEWQTDQQREQEGDGGKFDGSWRVLRYVIQHRPLRADRDAEIAVEDAGEKDPVAIPQRQIEPPFVAERRDHVGIVRRDVAKLGQHRIARHHVGDQEDHQCRQQDHQGGQDEARDDVAKHAEDYCRSDLAGQAEANVALGFCQ